MTYFDRLPADINRLIEEYASREIAVEYIGCRMIEYGGWCTLFTIIFHGPVTISLPFSVLPDVLKDWTKHPSYLGVDEWHTLGNLSGTSIYLSRVGNCIKLQTRDTIVAVFNPRQSEILYRKLQQIARRS